MIFYVTTHFVSNFRIIQAFFVSGAAPTSLYTSKDLILENPLIKVFSYPEHLVRGSFPPKTKKPTITELRLCDKPLFIQ